MFATISLLIVFILISIRQVGRFSIPIWLAMAFGAALALASSSISPANAFSAINFDILLFLLGMFVISAALEASGLLEEAANRILSRAKDGKGLLFLLIVFFGIGSAMLLNDTMAIVAAPMLIYIASKIGSDPKPLIIVACFAITIGSMATPVGNPQNLLVALDGSLKSPFLSFAIYLLPPAAISLAALYFIFLWLFPSISSSHSGSFKPIYMVRDRHLAAISAASIGLLCLLLFLRAVFPVFPISAIAIFPSIIILAFSSRRLELFSKADWHTLLFFTSMFILMRAVWDEGLFQGIIASNSSWLEISSLPAVIAVSTVLSQFISNVPLVSLYLPILTSKSASNSAYLALAGASTLAGNLTILGAASNVILLEGARKRGISISFFEFAKYGFLMTLVPLAILFLWLNFVP